jgi:uncharacterized membrane protein YcaP (DUF421 family)
VSLAKPATVFPWAMDIVLRAIVLFAFVFLVVRVMGRRELAELEPLDLILLIMLGDAVQQGLTQDDYSVTGAVLAVSTIALLQVAVTFLSWRFKAVRRLTKGDPIVLVEDGKPIEPNLRRERIRIEELADKMRGQQIASLDDVAWAVLESGGVTSASSRRTSKLWAVAWCSCTTNTPAGSSRRSESTIRLSGPLSAHCSTGRTTAA